ncbi:hypothetical protein [Williamsia serinedens]|uniref:Uncharacterized protein n=1 Tax=Williamsia serinedens TaxID=391736 RepID=A0ABT1H7A4_9NOCA|nr:hypothetical protein [Williamsia serinedens]MCP2163116.1 hypothetical protein [Williamsia serinedens]
MTAPEVFQVRDGDGWEVYVTNPAGGWWLLGSVGGSAVVHTLPDGAEVLMTATELRQIERALGGDRRG